MAVGMVFWLSDWRDDCRSCASSILQECAVLRPEPEVWGFIESKRKKRGLLLKANTRKGGYRVQGQATAKIGRAPGPKGVSDYQSRVNVILPASEHVLSLSLSLSLSL